MALQDQGGNLMALFDIADTNNNGKLDRQEIAGLCRQLELKMNKKALDSAMAEMDEKGFGMVGFRAFKAWYDKQNIGYKMTQSFLFTPRGTRHSLDSPRFAQALSETGVDSDTMRKASDYDLSRNTFHCFIAGRKNNISCNLWWRYHMTEH